jgi:hypothetical protein
MGRIIFVTLLLMVVSVPALATDNDRGVRMDEAKEAMRALKDQQMQERSALQDEYHSKMMVMRERQLKEREDLKAKYGMSKDGQGGMGQK